MNFKGMTLKKTTTKKHPKNQFHSGEKTGENYSIKLQTRNTV